MCRNIPGQVHNIPFCCIVFALSLSSPHISSTFLLKCIQDGSVWWCAFNLMRTMYTEACHLPFTIRIERRTTILSVHRIRVLASFAVAVCTDGWLVRWFVCMYAQQNEKRQIYYSMWMDFVCIQGVCGPSMCWILVSFFSASHQFNGNNVWREQKKNAYISLDVIGSMTDFGCCFADISPKSSTIEHAQHLYLSSG